MDLLAVIGAGWLLPSVAVFARLRIADLLHQHGQPMTTAEIAQATETNPEAMLRLLRVLAGAGILKSAGGGTFTNSPVSEQLRSDHPRSMRHFCMLSGEEYYQAWGGLLHTVKTGQPAFKHVFGSSIYEYMDKNRDTAAVYDRAMEDFARPVADAVARSYDFSGIRTIVDVGGGAGTMLKGILALHPHLQGVCVDIEHVCVRARENLHDSDPALSARLAYAPGDFFNDIPASGDIYILKNVLHNWNRESCVRILNTVHKAMTRNAAERPEERPPRLLIIEPLVEHDETAMRALMNALFQITICEQGTRERTEAEMRELSNETGFAVLSVTKLSTSHSVIECALSSTVR